MAIPGGPLTLRVLGNDVPMTRLAVRMLFALCLGLSVLFVAELWVDLSRTEVPWEKLEPSSRSAQALASTVSRAFNNLTAMVLTFIALAVPITANMYTPKLVEIFVRDRVNLAVMAFFAAMGAHAIFGQAIAYDAWAPSVTYAALWVSGVVGFVVLIPYYFYVLSFLDPATIIRRVTDAILGEFDAVLAKARPLSEGRRRLDQSILNLGNVILRAVDRADRDVSLDAIRGLQRAVTHYGEIKSRLEPAWFEVEPALFTGSSRDAIGYIVRDRVWVEHKCLHQLLLAYSVALAKMPDAISAISGVNRRIAEFARGKGDDGVLELCVRYFNTFLREAVKKKDLHAIYDVYSQYTFLAKELLVPAPKAVERIARHFRYYAEFARWQGMPFVFELAAHDLESVVEAAYERGSSSKAALLRAFLEFETDKAGARLPKAQVVLAAYFGAKGLAEERALVLAALDRATPAQIEEARRSMLSTDDPVFWEVTDRQTNLDFVPRDRVEAARAVLDECAARKRGGADPAS